MFHSYIKFAILLKDNYRNYFVMYILIYTLVHILLGKRWDLIVILSFYNILHRIRKFPMAGGNTGS